MPSWPLSPSPSSSASLWPMWPTAGGSSSWPSPGLTSSSTRWPAIFQDTTKSPACCGAPWCGGWTWRWSLCSGPSPLRWSSASPPWTTWWRQASWHRTRRNCSSQFQPTSSTPTGFPVLGLSTGSRRQQSKASSSTSTRWRTSWGWVKNKDWHAGTSRTTSETDSYVGRQAECKHFWLINWPTLLSFCFLKTPIVISYSSCHNIYVFGFLEVFKKKPFTMFWPKKKLQLAFSLISNKTYFFKNMLNIIQNIL